MVIYYIFIYQIYPQISFQIKIMVQIQEMDFQSYQESFNQNKLQEIIVNTMINENNSIKS